MKPTPMLAGKNALVTGAGSGIGRGAALRLAAEGARVALVDQDRAALDEVRREIAAGVGEALIFSADVSKTAAMKRVYARVEKTWRRLDVVFANAGINGVWTRLEELKPEAWDRTLAVNLRGTFLTVKFALPLMKKHGGAVIITSSVQGTRVFSNSGATAYATSKAAQLAFGRMCALELADRGIRVNTICPGGIKTEIGKRTIVGETRNLHLPVKYPKGTVPLSKGKPGSTDQVADAVAFLATDAASHITGTEIYIDGGESLLLG